jgi:lysophospholipase
VAGLLPDCEHITVEDAMHEILMEKDDKRAEFWAGFDRMLARAGV